MAYASGQGESLYMGPESSFKVMPGSAVADKLPVISPSIAADPSEFTSEALTGSGAPRPTVYGKVKVNGSFQIESSSDSLGMPLRGLMGATSTNQGTVALYDHIFAWGAQTESFFIEERHT